MEALHTFDSTQTTQLTSIETSIQSMKEWVQNIEGLFMEGLTDVDFPSDKWTSMAVGSDITKQLTAMGMSVGNILGKKEAASLIEQAVNKEFVVDEYNDIGEVSDIAGTYYTLADGRILREFYGPFGALTYTFVERIPKEKVGGAIETGEKFFSWMSTAADFIPGVSNGKCAFEGVFGVDPITGDKLSGWEQGLAGAAIIGGPLVKLGKGAVKVGGEAVGKIKNVLHPDKAKDMAKKAYEDYIKSPLQKGYTYFKEYKKKLGDIEYSSHGELVLEGIGAADSKTWGDLANDVKSKAVYMFKKLDEKIGGKGASVADDIFKQGKKVVDKFNIDEAYVKPKHLSTTKGNGAKLLGDSKGAAEQILKDSMKNGTVQSITDNGLTKLGKQSYSVIIDAGKTMGTKGENLIKVVLSEDGGMLSAYPIK